MARVGDSGLIFDDIERDGPGLHALLIGVSKYPHLRGGDDEAEETYGLGQLVSPARTVRDLADLLLRDRASLSPPLKTCRLLVSPSTSEGALAVPNNGQVTTRP